jgi:DNA-binding NarL/FixJ family response regulator
MNEGESSNENNAVQVLLYSDQTFLAEGLASAFRDRPLFQLAASCGSIAEAAEIVKDRDIHIGLIELTEEVTVPALLSIRRASPHCRLVLWISAISRELAFQAMELGVRGILRRSTPAERFFTALRTVHEGDLWFEKEMLESFLHGKRVVLTRREGQLVSLLSQGLKNKEIAWTLQISEGTVKVYLSRLFKKLGVADRFELALFGLKNMQSGYASSVERGTAALAADGTAAGLMALHSVLITERGAPLPPDAKPMALHSVLIGKRGPPLPPDANERRPLGRFTPPLRPHN